MPTPKDKIFFLRLHGIGGLLLLVWMLLAELSGTSCWFACCLAGFLVQVCGSEEARRGRWRVVASAMVSLESQSWQ